MEIRYNINNTISNRSNIRSLKILAIENNNNLVSPVYINGSIIEDMMSKSTGANDKLITVEDVISELIPNANGFNTYVNGGKGAPGITGAQGLAGKKGIIGSNGITGSQGITGSRGIQGLRGVTGIKGIAANGGIPGDKGPTGSIGLTGTIGVRGSIGSTGIIGTTGVQGAQGPKGLDGTGNPGRGSRGVQGITGSKGSKGPSGIGMIKDADGFMMDILSSMSSHGMYIDTKGNITIPLRDIIVEDTVESSNGTFVQSTE
jgi:hypothetical protein